MSDHASSQQPEPLAQAASRPRESGLKVLLEKSLEPYAVSAHLLGITLRCDESDELTYGWLCAGKLALLVEAMLGDALRIIRPASAVEVSFHETSRDLTVCVRFTPCALYEDGLDRHAGETVARSFGGRFERQALLTRELALLCSIPAGFFWDAVQDLAAP